MWKCPSQAPQPRATGTDIAAPVPRGPPLASAPRRIAQRSLVSSHPEPAWILPPDARCHGGLLSPPHQSCAFVLAAGEATLDPSLGGLSRGRARISRTASGTETSPAREGPPSSRPSTAPPGVRRETLVDKRDGTEGPVTLRARCPPGR